MLGTFLGKDQGNLVPERAQFALPRGRFVLWLSLSDPSCPHGDILDGKGSAGGVSSRYFHSKQR